MCTLTWLTHSNGYEVFFNRDEQRTRPRSEPPKYDPETNSIMPIDPQGKGTWIAVNNSGLTLCILNNYQAKPKSLKRNHLSRGLIIPHLIKHQQYTQLLSDFLNIDFDNYMPFWLCIFPGNLTKHTESPYAYQWNGESLTEEKTYQPFTSSAVMLEEVKKERSMCFERYIKNDSNRKKHFAYHSSHDPEKGQGSVCMHRDDACTQSFSHISVNKEIVFRFHDGPPCLSNELEEIVMNFA